VLPIQVLNIPNSPTTVLCSGCKRHLVANWGETGQEMATECCLSVLVFFYKSGILTVGSEQSTHSKIRKKTLFKRSEMNAGKNILLMNFSSMKFHAGTHVSSATNVSW
jgi:hypothetical protein